MKLSSIAACLAVAVLAAVGYAQETVSFDFEDITDISQLTDAGWVFVDDRGHDVGGVPMQFLDTIQIETTIVHGGGKALRLGVWDIAYYPLNGQFGTLDLWAYDFGNLINAYVTSADGPRCGLRKFRDVDVSIYYPDSEPVDHGILPDRAYGIGVGLIQRSFLNSDGGYGVEWGATPHIDVAMCSEPTVDYDPAAPAANSGWPGDQSWFGPSWLGYLPNGRPAGGWNHWRITYREPGVVEIALVESTNGNSHTATGTPSAPFDGTIAGGVDDIFLYGGRSPIEGVAPEQWFGDGIYDDITWTPLSPPPPTCNPGDADADGDVDLDDFVILKQNFGTTAGATCGDGDFDEDGDVDLDDFVLLKQNFGMTY